MGPSNIAAGSDSGPAMVPEEAAKEAEAPKEPNVPADSQAPRQSEPAKKSWMRVMLEACAGTVFFVAALSSIFANYPSVRAVAITTLSGLQGILGQGTDQVDWLVAQRTGTVEAFEHYLSEHPYGDYVSDAKSAIAAIIEDDNAWNVCQTAATVEAFENYLRRYSHGRHVAEVQAALKEAIAAREQRRQQCVAAARAKISDTIQKLVPALESKLPQPRPAEYFRNHNPKALSICINWSLSTPEKGVDLGYGMVTPAYVAGGGIEADDAISRCEQDRDSQHGDCVCVPVYQNNTFVFRPPEQWLSEQCRSVK